MRLGREEFLEVVDRAPLVSIDLAVRDAKGRVLLGKRTNEPAKGCWFVPGGRIHKNERLDAAFRRICLDELGKQYYVTAKAKGLTARKALLKYPFRMSLNPFMADIGNLLPHLVSGSILVSLVLSLPTVGPILLSALKSQDQFLAGFILMFVAMLTVVGMLISDLLLAWLDPRIRLGGR